MIQHFQFIQEMGTRVNLSDLFYYFNIPRFLTIIGRTSLTKFSLILVESDLILLVIS
jgi:hypothetical protein